MKIHIIPFILIIGSIIYQNNLTFAQDCTRHTKCRDCIQAGPECVWCSDTDKNLTTRCTDSQNMGTCDYPENPLGNVNIVTDNDFNASIQVRPQYVKMQLRRYESKTFQLSVKPAPNFPLDLYYLMDLSYSMNDDLENLRSLSTQIAQRIRSISNNSRLGFGSFVDKPTAPYILTVENRLKDPCLGGCKPPYSFHHSLKLTDNITTFESQVNAQIISGNLDVPEGGFDALLQAIVCTDEIGWKAGARHLLLMVTDASYHQANEGILGGAVKPHDGKCHLEFSNELEQHVYTEPLELDYPSIAQINEKLHEFNIVPIFAITEKFADHYTLITEQISGLYVGELAEDSSNVVDLIADAYQQISTTIQVRPPNMPGLEFTVTPTCQDTNSNGECIGIDVGDVATYNITVKLTECSNVSSNIRVIFFGDIQLDVEAVCNCDCENTPVDNSTSCNGQQLVCGMCDCNQRYGEFCQCSTDLRFANFTCTNIGSNNEICSNRGECICGECICNQPSNPDDVISGRYCECDNFSCERDDQLQLCGGSSQGVCECGNCQCQRHPNGQLWTKQESDICDCTPDTQECVGQNGEICSANGECICGQCECITGYNSASKCYKCEDFDVCSNSLCSLFERCVLCFLDGNTDCACFNTTQVVFLESDFNNTLLMDNSDVTECRMSVGQCFYVYFIETDPDDNVLFIWVDPDAVCDISIPLWTWLGPLLGLLALLIIGLIIALMLLKAFIYFLDLREYKAFMDQLAKGGADMNENPLYLSQGAEVDNPIYAQNTTYTY